MPRGALRLPAIWHADSVPHAGRGLPAGPVAGAARTAVVRLCQAKRAAVDTTSELLAYKKGDQAEALMAELRMLSRGLDEQDRRIEDLFRQAWPEGDR